MPEKPLPFANTPRFYNAYGFFFAIWSSVELNVDLAICRCLKINPEQVHPIVAGLHFGQKAALLRSLLPTSDFKNAAQLKGFLTRIGKEAIRNVLAHSFLASDHESIHFIYRQSQGQYEAMGYRFTADGFVQHVTNFGQLAEEFEKALGFSKKEIGDFAAACFKEEKSAATSPQDPSCKA